MTRQNRNSTDGCRPLIRTFCAFAVSPQDQADLDQALTPIRQEIFGFHWVPPERWHMTAQFFGDIPLDKAHSLAAALAALALPPLNVQVQGVGTFPSKKKPRVLWVGVQGVDEELTDIATQIHEVSHSMGFPPEKRPYRPHITIGRVARNTGSPLPSFEPWSNKTLGRYTLEPLTVFQSHQNSSGLQYIPIIPSNKRK